MHLFSDACVYGNGACSCLRCVYDVYDDDDPSIVILLWVNRELHP